MVKAKIYSFVYKTQLSYFSYHFKKQLLYTKLNFNVFLQQFTNVIG